MRYKMVVEYDGSAFHGWQSQACGGGVQDALSLAVQSFCGEKVVIYGAGRTDSGVHALGQVAHVDLDKDVSPLTLSKAVNFYLKKKPVVVVKVDKVAQDFNARFSATQRCYFYRILNRQAAPTVTMARVWHCRPPLNVAAMHGAAQVFVGSHDFTTFRAAGCQASSPVKTIDFFEVLHSGEEVFLTIKARSFLYRQVRSMVGALALVGLGRWQNNKLHEALKACDRRACPLVAPPHGLYLHHVSYG